MWWETRFVSPWRNLIGETAVLPLNVRNSEMFHVKHQIRYGGCNKIYPGRGISVEW